MEREGYNLPAVFWVVNLPVLSVHTNGNLTSVLGVMMYKERKVTASQSMMRQDAGRGNGGVWKPPVEKYIRITPINTSSASVATLAAATPTTCLCAVTLRWIQSSSHVKQPHLRSVHACRHLQTRGSIRGL